MKTTKFIAIALILGLATWGYAQTEPAADKTSKKPTHSLVMPLKKALHNPGLVLAMRSQLNDRFLQVDRKLYTVPVRYNHSTTYVAGTYAEWKRFFGTKSEIDPQLDYARTIQFSTALQNKRLVAAMRAQLNAGMLTPDKKYYTFPVRYSHSVVYVLGSQSDWIRFFSFTPKPISLTK